MMGHECEETFAMLQEYLDVELPAEACESCAEFAESLRRTVELCRGYEPETMPGPVSEAARAELMAAWKRARG